MTTQPPSLASQATAELPKLPEPFQYISDGTANDDVPVFTADQMNAHYLAGVEAGRASRAGSEPEFCPYCDGSGDSTARSGGGPDSWDEPCICPRCKGAQTLRAAYDTLAEELPPLQLKVAQLGIFHSHATRYGWAPNQTDGMQSFAEKAAEWLTASIAPAAAAEPSEELTSRLAQRVIDLHDKASMPWSQAGELALSEFGFEEDDLRELIGEFGQCLEFLASRDEIEDFDRHVLVFGPDYLPKVPLAEIMTTPDRAGVASLVARMTRLKDAIEGECDGLAITDDVAKEIIAYIDTGLPPYLRSAGEAQS